MNPTAPCPRCARPNAAFRVTCLYCGEAMPNPVARPPEPTRRAPDNLDVLVREAMRGGGVGRLRAALEQSAHADVEPPPPAPAGSPTPARAPVARRDDWRDRLTDAARRAVHAAPSGPSTGDTEALRAALLDVEAALSAAYGLVPDDAPVLPPIRLPYLLLLPPGGDADALAAELGVDAATARLLATGRWPRVGLRGDAPALGRAGNHRVVHRDALLAVPEALGVLAVGADWRVTDERIWLADPQGGGARARVDDIRLIVPGEVETRTTRAGPDESRWLRKRLAAAGSSTERRVRVADLHTAGAVFRLVEGVTRAEGVPGLDPNSSRRSFTALLDHLRAAHPGAEVVPDRTVAVGADGRSAWPQWEEHTRVCRVFTRV